MLCFVDFTNTTVLLLWIWKWKLLTPKPEKSHLIGLNSRFCATFFDLVTLLVLIHKKIYQIFIHSSKLLKNSTFFVLFCYKFLLYTLILCSRTANPQVEKTHLIVLNSIFCSIFSYQFIFLCQPIIKYP